MTNDALEKSYRPYDRKFLNPDEGGSNEQYLSSAQRETIQSRQSVSKLNKNTDSMVAKQILCKARVCVDLAMTKPFKMGLLLFE
jgi:hypothetical protein